MSTIARALRRLWPAGLFAAALAAHAGERYTAEEKRLLKRLPEVVTAQCVQAAEQRVAAMDEARRASYGGTLDTLLEDVRRPGGFCTCATDDVMRHMTPELAHSADFDAGMDALMAQAAARCMPEQFRRTFAKVCPDFARRAYAGFVSEASASDAVPGICRCMQARVDKLSPQQLLPYIQAMAQGRPGASAATQEAVVRPMQEDFANCAITSPPAASPAGPASAPPGAASR